MKFLEIMEIAGEENDVGRQYKNIIEKYFPNSAFVSLHTGINYDGIFMEKKLGLNILAEFKFEKDIIKRKHLIDCIIQLLYYIKKIERIGEVYPNVLFVGNRNVCTCFHSDLVLKYLDYDIDWINIQPCDASRNNPELHNDLMSDEKINPYIFSIFDTDFKEVIDRIISLNYGVQRKIMINEFNVTRLFNEFITYVVVGACKYYNPNELVSIFINILNNPSSNHLHPLKPNMLQTSHLGNVRVNASKFKSFFSYVQTYYTPDDKDKLTAISDRLIEDLTRRIKGEFYTETIWVNKVHAELERLLGADWRDKYVVWDPAWGTGNLTRDYYFREFYASTINQSDLDIANTRGYNSNSTILQYDFLNNDVFPSGIVGIDDKSKLPEGLQRALRENKKILILMNPPYVTASNTMMNLGSRGKKGVTKTRINEIMLDNKLGNACSQLYAQFLFRVLLLKKQYNLTNIHIAVFSKTSFLSTTSFSRFREIFLSQFNFRYGMLFNAANFSNVTRWWPVLFSVFSAGESTEKSEFQCDICEFDNTTITTTGQKTLYNLNGYKTATEWIKEPITNLQKEEKKNVILYGGLKYKIKKQLYPTNILGSMHINYNSMRGNEQYTGLYSGLFKYGTPIMESNLHRIISLFTVKRCAVKNQTWLNDNDEYKEPNFLDDQFVHDCLIYSLFNNNSFQTSLREVQNVTVENEWFWLSNDMIADLSIQNDVVIQDVKLFNHDRFVYKLLQNINPSEDAQQVLTKATELLVISFPEREFFHNLHPEWHLNAWDAGWYQVRLMLKECAKSELKQFISMYKSLENKLRVEASEFGFLRTVT